MLKYTSALIFGLAIVLSAYLLGEAVINRNKKEDTISVTGLGSKDFTSDLIVWEGSFSSENTNLQQAYVQLDKDKAVVIDYFKSKGIAETDIVFQAITNQKNTKAQYNDEGRYVGETFLGYILRQPIKIESNNVEQIETISREITELLNKGIEFYSQPPRYYYTKLADLKIEMISEATEDARTRAEKIAEHSGGKLEKLKSAGMGIFQITGQNSNEDYSWGGTYNTSEKNKTASITMKLTYELN